MLVTMSGIAALAIFAVIEKSIVMLVSAVAIGIIVMIFRGARMRDRVIAIIVAGLGGSLGAEIVHTLYRYASAAEPESDSGGAFMSAILIGLINAGAIIVVLIATKAWLNFVDRKSR